VPTVDPHRWLAVIPGRCDSIEPGISRFRAHAYACPGMTAERAGHRNLRAYKTAQLESVNGSLHTNRLRAWKGGGHSALRLSPSYAFLPRLRVLAAHGVRVFPSIPPSSRTGGRREGRVPFAPMVRVQKKARGRTTGTSRTTGLPCAMVLTASFVLSPVRPGFVVTVRATPEASSRPRQCVNALRGGHLHRGARTTRLLRPRHAVRQTTRRVHRIPLPTSVTIAKRPSCGGGTRE
jgi:hypothetical protein